MCVCLGVCASVCMGMYVIVYLCNEGVGVIVLFCLFVCICRLVVYLCVFFVNCFCLILVYFGFNLVLCFLSFILPPYFSYLCFVPRHFPFFSLFLFNFNICIYTFSFVHLST